MPKLSSTADFFEVAKEIGRPPSFSVSAEFKEQVRKSQEDYAKDNYEISETRENITSGLVSQQFKIALEKSKRSKSVLDNFVKTVKEYQQRNNINFN
ncbi:MAG TPA: hypothetical protein PLH65_00960 [bacterium]|nr:hypothetical protein [bacterium]